jgi:DNA mismatch repair protein MutL
MAIKLLQDDLINKIAAGEVVERPASIVKELVENAIDAGATKINVNIVRGGIDSVEVEDNGSGIAPDELMLAFQRHATSKIGREEDLNNIATMGFRGEALPSIASVSKIQIMTAQTDKPGIQAVLEGGVLINSAPCSCPPGTRIMINDVFYNTPARREFLKTPVTEGNNVHEIMNRLALSRPDISFKFSNQNKTFFKTPGKGDLMDTVTSIYGRDFSQNLIPVAYDSDRFSISGLISPPEITRTNRKNQLFFVNTRAIRSPMLYKTVDQAYRGLLISQEFPLAFLFINMPPAEIDANVHPQKTEVRFRDEKVIFRLVVEVIRDTLGQLNYKYNLPTQLADSEPYTPDYDNGRFEFSTVAPRESGMAYQNMTKPDNTENRYDFTSLPASDTPLNYRVMGQCFNSYIMIEKENELVLIDQHAAHERINYDILRSAADKGNMSQALAFPVSVQLSVKSMQVLENNLQTLTSLGFTIDIIGPREIAIRTAPWAARGNERETILEILELLQEDKLLDVTDEAYKLLACKKSIKAGQVLSRLEMETIIADLLKLPDYRNCPHGRPVILSISRQEMDHHFKRI